MNDIATSTPTPDPDDRSTVRVGARVLVDPVTDPDPVTDRSDWLTGQVIDDYADTLTATTTAGGPSWAPGRRWAIALDDGRLVFRDNDRVRVDETADSDRD